MPTTESSLPAYSLPRNPRYQSLDIWRGIVCLMAIAVHASMYSRLWQAHSWRWLHDSVGDTLVNVVFRFEVAVQIFFVISGYCIAATADSTRRKPRAMVQYFKRRFRRIFPPYWIVLALTAFMVLFASMFGLGSVYSHETSIPHPGTLTPLQWFGNISLIETWRPQVLPPPESKFVLVTAWTLCYEEQFYVVCGLILLFCPRWFFAACTLVSALTIGLLPWTILKPASPFAGFFFDGQWLVFAAGVLIYYLVNYTSGWNARLLFLLLILAFLGCVVLRYGLLRTMGADTLQKTRGFELVVGFAFAILLLSLHRWDASLTAMPILKPLGFCGAMCYSVYLIHWPIIKPVTHFLAWIGIKDSWPTLLITIPTAIISSLFASWIFYRLIERRFINSPSQFVSPKVPEPIATKPDEEERSMDVSSCPCPVTT